MAENPGHDVIVIGASLGGIQALSELVTQLPADLPAAVFIVQHTYPTGKGLLAEILDRLCPLKVAVAKDGEPIEHGRVYVAPPDFHLLLGEGVVRLNRGPRENRTRPAIDPLFRSAAIRYRSRVIGVVLTGMLDDGSAGLVAIKRCGGLAVVQELSDAVYSDMPEAALEGVNADYCIPINGMGAILAELARQPAPAPGPPPLELTREIQTVETADSDFMLNPPVGEPTEVSCPECGGPLRELDADRVSRYRCHNGHAYTARTLLAVQDEAVEQALWSALEALDARALVLEKLARDMDRRGVPAQAGWLQDRATKSREHAEQIRRLLTRGD